jgi:cytochrome bd-type quinol oxidase subunit 2
MNPFDASQLEPLPAPFWFIQLFKVLGFTLHMVPMHLWYAGLVVAAGLYAFGGQHARRCGSRLAGQLPVLVALGINFGIVPLLFLQLGYAKAFYPATILMAWPWLAIIALLIPAYYGVYLYASGLRDGGPGMMPLRRASGWTAAVLFLAIGFLFANGLSLMTNVGAWRDLWEAHSVGGAATGTAMNTGDATLWPRWLLMFGLALGTTAVWAVVDAAWLGRHESAEYKHWARQFALRTAFLGAGWATIAGSWYVLTWSAEVRSEMFGLPTILLTLLTAVSPCYAAALLWFWRKREIGPREVAAVAGVQFVTLALNAISRQIVQNVELGARLFHPADRPGQFDWGPLALFLITFLIGAAVVAWILRELSKATKASQ